MATPSGGYEAEPEEDRIEAAYWRFDARHKGYGKWKASPMSERDAFKAEMRNALAAEKTRKDAAETLRNMSTYVSTYAPDRPSTPVGWSDTDWLKHLDEIRRNEAAYARGPLPERGWD